MVTILIYMQNETTERYNMTEQTNNKTEERKNRFSGQSIMLTKEESIIHDRIFINELAATLEDKAQALTVRQSFGTKYVKI
jgi:hypothetical protein